MIPKVSVIIDKVVGSVRTYLTDKVTGNSAGVTTDGRLKVDADLSGVSFSGAFPLPTDGATKTMQNTQEASLNSIQAAVEALNAKIASEVRGALKATAVEVLDASGNQITTFGVPWNNANQIGNTAFTANAGTNLNTSALSTYAKQDSLITLLGEIATSPSENTVLARLKDILTNVVLSTGTHAIGSITNTSFGVSSLPAIPTGSNAIGSITNTSFGLDDTQAAPIYTVSKTNGRSFVFETTSFLTGASPATHTVNTTLGRNASWGVFVNDGPGTMQVQFSDDGTNYCPVKTFYSGDRLILTGMDINKVKVTWIADSAYRLWCW